VDFSPRTHGPSSHASRSDAWKEDSIWPAPGPQASLRDAEPFPRAKPRTEVHGCLRRVATRRRRLRVGSPAGARGWPALKAPQRSLQARTFRKNHFVADFSLWRRFTGELKMTETRTLLADYAEDGSEDAFGELAARYIGLAYSTALRLVGGDAQFAEDVTQTVFVHLARKARALPGEVMLEAGLWV